MKKYTYTYITYSIKNNITNCQICAHDFFLINMFCFIKSWVSERSELSYQHLNMWNDNKNQTKNKQNEQNFKLQKSLCNKS